jgi:hypothetical protein
MCRTERSEAPVASSIQRARRESREGNGGGVGSGVPRGGGRKRERGWVRGQQPNHGVRVALGGAVEGGSARSRRRWAGEQGRAVGRG